ncbi:MAG TPA: SRPBCC family protein [Conexibacter sp.]|nr:SRPBCC family protein [Conexibacter sp.]
MPTMASSGTAKVTLPADDQILITREFDAPKHLVYEAWTTPELVKRWWSGKRGTVTLAEIDLRVGGRWRYVMTAGEGGFEVGFHGEYRELVPNERIVSTEVFEGLPDHGIPGGESLNTLTLTEVDGRTTLAVHVQHRSKEDRDGHINSGMEGGMQESMDALEQVAISLA